MATDSLATEWVLDRKLVRPPAFTSRLDPDGRHVQANGSVRDLDQILDRLTAAGVVLNGAYVGNAVQRNQASCVLQPAVQDLLTVFREDDWRDLGRSDRLTVATVASDVAEQIRVSTPGDWSLRSESLLRVITGGTEVVKTVAADSPAVSGEILAKIISNTPVGGVERWYDPFAKLTAATVHSVVGNFLRAASAALEAREFEVDWVVRQELHRVVDYLIRGAGSDPDFSRTARQLHHALRERVDWSDPPEVESFFFNDAMLCVADGRVWKAIERLEARAEALERLDAPALIVGNRMLIDRLKSGGRSVEPPVGFEHLGAMLGAGFLPDYVAGKGSNGTGSGLAFGSHHEPLLKFALPDSAVFSGQRNRVTVYLFDLSLRYSSSVSKQELRSRQKVESPGTASEQEDTPQMPPRPAERPLLNVNALINRMRTAFRLSGLTGPEVGERMGYPKASAKQNIYRLLKPKDENSDEGPRILLIANFARAVGVPLCTLLDPEREPTPTTAVADRPLTMAHLQKKMRLAIERSGLSRNEIGRYLGVTPGSENQAVYNLVDGAANADSDVLRVDRLARACGITVAELLQLS